MTLKNFCGFETGDFAETVAGAEGSGGVSGVSISSSGARTGTYCLAIDPASGSDAGFCRFSGVSTAGAPSDLGISTCYISVGFKVSTLPDSIVPILEFQEASGATIMRLRLTSDSRISICDNGDSEIHLTDTVLELDHWYRLQIYLDTTSDPGRYSLKFGNDLAVIDAGSFGNDPIAKVLLGMFKNEDSSTPLFYFDDLAISSSDDFSTQYSDATGVYCAVPNAAGSVSGWTSGTGSTYAEIDEIPTDSDTTYLAQTAGSTHSVNISSPSLGSPVLGVKCWARARNTSSGGMNTRISQGASVASGSPVSMTSSYKDFFQLRLTDPASGVEFTEANIGSLQIGIVATVKTGNVRCTTMALMVLAHDNSASLTFPTSSLASTGVGKGATS